MHGDCDQASAGCLRRGQGQDSEEECRPCSQQLIRAMEQGGYMLEATIKRQQKMQAKKSYRPASEETCIQQAPARQRAEPLRVPERLCPASLVNMCNFFEHIAVMERAR